MRKTIKIGSQEEIRELLGAHDRNLKLIEKELKVKIVLRDEEIRLNGTAGSINKAYQLVNQLLRAIRLRQAGGEEIDLYSLIKNFKQGRSREATLDVLDAIVPQNLLKVKQVGPRTNGQKGYAEAISNNDIVFGLGPAGTGKTYLAMASAVEALKKQEVRRLILTRPAIEAGESLGYLPGNMIEKVSPYLRPLYDALYDMMEAEHIEKYLENGIIEVAPLAYMRGRTLNDAFIILDEAQNCTAEQMKMFLTRLGFDSRAVITGDITQSDLPQGKPTGLLQAQEILKGIEGIQFVYLTGSDVVRHGLVQKIIEAYDGAGRNNK
ncbi:MAG: PhoH family protein [Candidatus Omnitrophica bacterium]|nr:PhoH family protein [Candidatus Omnitrophota bacterium]